MTRMMRKRDKMMEYRKLEERDFPSLSRLQRAYKVSVHESLPKPDQLDRLKAAMEKGCIEFYGAFDREKLVGICSLCRTFSTFRYECIGVLEDLYVLTDYRGKGVAKELVDEIYRQAGLSTLSVTCSEENLPLFRSFGFRYDLGVGYLRID